MCSRICCFFRSYFFWKSRFKTTSTCSLKLTRWVFVELKASMSCCLRKWINMNSIFSLRTYDVMQRLHLRRSECEFFMTVKCSHIIDVFFLFFSSETALSLIKKARELNNDIARETEFIKEVLVSSFKSFFSSSSTMLRSKRFMKETTNDSVRLRFVSRRDWKDLKNTENARWLKLRVFWCINVFDAILTNVRNFFDWTETLISTALLKEISLKAVMFVAAVESSESNWSECWINWVIMTDSNSAEDAVIAMQMQMFCVWERILLLILTFE